MNRTGLAGKAWATRSSKAIDLETGANRNSKCSVHDLAPPKGFMKTRDHRPPVFQDHFAADGNCLRRNDRILVPVHRFLFTEERDLPSGLEASGWAWEAWTLPTIFN